MTTTPKLWFYFQKQVKRDRQAKSKVRLFQVLLEVAYTGTSLIYIPNHKYAWQVSTFILLKCALRTITLQSLQWYLAFKTQAWAHIMPVEEFDFNAVLENILQINFMVFFLFFYYYITLEGKFSVLVFISPAFTS